MRSRSMQALTDAIKRRYPGVVIYGVGDAAHRLHASDHNEDDTAGSLAAQSDADSIPEHRAIDVMIGPAFTKSDGDWLVRTLTTDPRSRARLLNVIWYGGIWSRSWGWTRRTYTGTDQHTNHPHISGLAADDGNAADWPMIDSGGGADLMLGPCKKGDTGTSVTTLQIMLRNCGEDPGPVDGQYGDKVASALLSLTKSMGSGLTSGDSFTPTHYLYVHAKLAQVMASKAGAGATVDQVADEIARRMAD